MVGPYKTTRAQTMLYPASVSSAEHIQSQETPKLSTITLTYALTHTHTLQHAHEEDGHEENE